MRAAENTNMFYRMFVLKDTNDVRAAYPCRETLTASTLKFEEDMKTPVAVLAKKVKTVMAVARARLSAETEKPTSTQPNKKAKNK